MLCLSRSVVSSSLQPPDYSPSGSSVHGILQVNILEWVAMPSSRGSSQPRYRTQVFHIACGFFTTWATRKAIYPHKRVSFSHKRREVLIPVRTLFRWTLRTLCKVKKVTWKATYWMIPFVQNVQKRQTYGNNSTGLWLPRAEGWWEWRWRVTATRNRVSI